MEAAVTPTPFRPRETVQRILGLHQDTVADWHESELSNEYSGLLEVVCRQHQFNFQLWHEEDIARSPDVSDAEIARVKRSIDRFNQQRNDAIEQIDEALLVALTAADVSEDAQARLNSETPGSVIDRLSILSLRIYHLQEQIERSDATTEHLEKVNHRLQIAHVQLADLSRSLIELLTDIFAGRKQLKVYRQMKMYNDPTMNPYLYQRQPRKAG